VAIKNLFTAYILTIAKFYPLFYRSVCKILYIILYGLTRHLKNMHNSKIIITYKEYKCPLFLFLIFYNTLTPNKY